MLPSAQDKRCDDTRFSFWPCQLHITQMGFCERKDSSVFVSLLKVSPNTHAPEQPGVLLRQGLQTAALCARWQNLAGCAAVPPGRALLISAHATEAVTFMT